MNEYKVRQRNKNKWPEILFITNGIFKKSSILATDAPAVFGAMDCDKIIIIIIIIIIR